MPPRRGCHLAMPQEALLHDRDLVAIAPVTTARRIRGREDFNLGSELMVGHKVGLSTDAETPSDGLHRRHTVYRWNTSELSILWIGAARTADHIDPPLRPDMLAAAQAVTSDEVTRFLEKLSRG